MNQGVHAAWNMLGKMVPYNSVPFFWTRLYNMSLHYTGHTNSFDNVHIDGKLEENKFVVYYGLKGKIVGAADLGKNNWFINN